MDSNIYGDFQICISVPLTLGFEGNFNSAPVFDLMKLNHFSECFLYFCFYLLNMIMTCMVRANILPPSLVKVFDTCHLMQG